MKCKNKPCHNKVRGRSKFCSKKCYCAYRYQTEPEFRKKKLTFATKWQKKHPEKWRLQNKKANHKWRTNNPKKISDLVNAWQKKVRAERIKLGLCTKCGNKTSKKFKTCLKCRIRWRGR